MSTSNMRLKLPAGFRFVATEEELVCHYLYGKLKGNLTPIEQQIVIDCDFYGEEEPWEIWERYGGQELKDGEDLFFFTQLKKVNPDKPTCKNFNRKVGNSGGKWHGETSGNCSSLDLHGLTAFKKRFTYKNPKNLEQDKCWNMLEYGLDFHDSIVLCQLKRSTRNPQSDKKRKLQNLDYGNEHNFFQNNGSNAPCVEYNLNKSSRFEEELSKMIQENLKNSSTIKKTCRDNNVAMDHHLAVIIPPNTASDHHLAVIDRDCCNLGQMLMQEQLNEEVNIATNTSLEQPPQHYYTHEEIFGDDPSSNFEANMIGMESNNNGLLSEEGQGPISGENTLQNVMTSSLQQPQPQLNYYESRLEEQETGAEQVFINNYGSEIAPTEADMMCNYDICMFPTFIPHQVQQEQQAATGMSNYYGSEVAETAALPVLNANYASEMAETENMIMGTVDQVGQEHILAADVRNGEDCAVPNESFNPNTLFSIEENWGDHPNSIFEANMNGRLSEEGQGPINGENTLQNVMASYFQQHKPQPQPQPQPQPNDYESWLLDESSPYNEMKLMKELLQYQLKKPPCF